MRTLFALLLSMMLLAGCTEKPTPPVPTAPNQMTSDQVRRVYLTPELPGVDKQILFPDRDGDKIAQILKWVEQATPVQEENLQRPKRSRTLHIERKDGTLIQVQWTWTCKKLGDNGGHCTTVRDRALVSGDGYQGDTYVQSKELYDFLSNTPRDWMPDVQKFSAPQQLQVGKPFSVSGNAWLSEKVTLQLSRDQQVVWSKEVPVDHGHFELKEQLPPDIKPGNYEFDAKGDEGSRGTTLQVVE